MKAPYKLENKYINIGQEEIEEVNSAISKFQLAGTADIVSDYEQQLAKYFKTKFALTISSGTAAEHLIMILLDINIGDEVIVPPTAPIMSVLPIIAVGAKPVFVDTNIDNFGFDPDDLRKKISTRTKAIISVPMWGYAINNAEIYSIAKANGIVYIEDASHCHGALDSNTRYIGTNSDISFFSTQERKLICTGEGGFILTNNEDYAERIQEIRDFGKPIRNIPEFEKVKNKYGYLFGLNFRITALSAALGIAQLNKLDEKIKIRTSNAIRIKENLSKINWAKEIRILEGSTPNYYSIVINLEDNIKGNEFAEYLFNNQVISDTYRFGIAPLYELPILSKYKNNCPNSANLLKKIITLPTHEGLQDCDIDKINNLFINYF